MSVEFVHLLTHTEYSIIDGICRIKPLLKRAKQLDLPAQAITDSCNLFGMVKFYQAAINEGIKPIIGSDIWFSPDKGESIFRLVLLCQNNHGYRNLTKLISKAYIEGVRRKTPIIDKAWLTAESLEGLIVLSGAKFGDLGKAIANAKYDSALEIAKFWQKLVPNRFYIELQSVDKGENFYITKAAELAFKLNLPLVATNDVCFLQQEDFRAHETRVCIHDGYQLSDPKRPHLYTEKQYLRSPKEMQEIFANYPEALTNTVEIAKRCNVELNLGENFLPKFTTPKDLSVADYLAQKARDGLIIRLDALFNNEEKKEKNKPTYFERLEKELTVINNMGFAGYFLIVADFIAWAKNNAIPVGPGRGSGAGSLVAYALGITDLDPLAYDLLFERFLNPERVSMPDFDIDFCMDKRDRVIEYVAERYGKKSVSQIITFGTMAAKAVIRDVGRALGQPYGFVDKVAKLIPFELGMTLEKALEEEALKKRYQEEDEVKELIDLARKLEGVTRNAGKHAGGVVISPSLLTDFTPLYCEEGGGNLVSQFDKDDVEAVGLVKFDFLGLRTLTIIDWALETIKKELKQDIDMHAISMQDEQTFKLLKECKTTAIFQLESKGMKDLIKRLEPDCFEDIIALVALFRPGPLQSGMVDDFINRKHGRAKVLYPHPALEPILNPTYGVILYQEQVMQIAQVLAGYSLGAADLLRRAMGKKKPEEMAKQRSIFVLGATERGVDKELASTIFDLMEKFAGYGFNKSHSAAYALVSYQTAWLKAHYPAAFMAAVLSSDMDNTDKVVVLIEESRAMGLNVNPPDINKGKYKFTIDKDGSIIYGLGAIKGVGHSAIEVLFQEREKNGEFKDLVDLCCRLDLRKVNKRVLEALIRSGALDSFTQNRAFLFASFEKAMQMAEQTTSNNNLGQGDLFSDAVTKLSLNEDDISFWSDEKRLKGEKETLGLYLTGHPITQYRDKIKHIISSDLANLRPAKDKQIIVAGFLIAQRILKTKRGNKMAILTLDDQSARVDVTVFSELLENSRHLLEQDQLIIAIGEASVDDYTGGVRVTAKEILNLQLAQSKFAKALYIKLNNHICNSDILTSLKSILNPYKEGKCPLIFQYSDKKYNLKIRPASSWMLDLKPECIDKIKKLLGEDSIYISY